MDDKFLEFWGNFLINTAKSKKQLDGFMETLKKSFTAPEVATVTTTLESLLTVFQKLYGFDKFYSKSGEVSEFNNLALKAVSDFQNTFKDYMMGFVSKKEHLELLDKYEKLKEKFEYQKETIENLRMLLNSKENKENKEIKEPKHEAINFIKQQSEFFQKIMKNIQQVSQANQANQTQTDKQDKQDGQTDKIEKQETRTTGVLET